MHKCPRSAAGYSHQLEHRTIQNANTQNQFVPPTFSPAAPTGAFSPPSVLPLHSVR